MEEKILNRGRTNGNIVFVFIITLIKINILAEIIKSKLKFKSKLRYNILA